MGQFSVENTDQPGSGLNGTQHYLIILGTGYCPVNGTTNDKQRATTRSHVSPLIHAAKQGSRPSLSLIPTSTISALPTPKDGRSLCRTPF
jgi:hypothetical protein